MRRLKQRDLSNKGKLIREFDTGDIVVVRKQVKSIINYRVYPKLVFKTKLPYIVPEKATLDLYWLN